MAIGREDAAQALREAEAAAGRSQRLHGYQSSSGFLILWGAVWAAMDVAYYVDPGAGNAISLAADAVGIAGSIWLGLRIKRQAGVAAWRSLAAALLIMLAIGLFGVGVQAITPLSGAGQGQAVAGLAVGCAYIVIGAVQGLRMAGVGLAMAVVTLGGWLFAREQFMLWMALGGGGGLMLGGWWLRTA